MKKDYSVQPLPEAVDVEKSVLSHFLLGDDAAFENFESLKDDHFNDRSNRIIFETIKMMLSKMEKVDVVTVTTKLKDLNLIQEVGGPAYLSSVSMFFGGHSPDQYIPILEEKMRLRKLIEISDYATKSAYNQVSSSDILKTIEDKSYSMQGNQSAQNLTQKACDSAMANLEMKKNGIKVFGLQTNVYSFDKFLGGLIKSRFYVLASRAGRGKTSMAEQMITNFLLNNKPVLIFEKDMSSEMLITRMACRKAMVPFSNYDLGNCSRQDLLKVEDAIKSLRESPLYVYSPSNLTANDLRSIVKMEKRTHGIEVVFLDHILNLDVGADYRIGLTMASSQIRASIQETEIPHVILAQLNRGADDKEEPSPSHIKEFDALYADCDVMCMIWAKERSADVPKGQLLPITFICNKNRYGAEFKDDLGFDRELMTFKPINKYR